MATNPFKVNVAQLIKKHGEVKKERRSGPIEGVAITASSVNDDELVEVDVTLESAEGGIVAAGSTTALWHAECARCLRPVKGKLKAWVRDLYQEVPEDEMSYPIVNDEIDLEQMAREALILELPPVPLCKPDCKGLCPVCGADWNTSQCNHARKTRDPRWEALDVLKEER